MPPNNTSKDLGGILGQTESQNLGGELKRRILGGAIAAAALATTVISAPNATAATDSTAACSSQYWYAGDGGYATLTTGGSVPVRIGPYSGCQAIRVPGGSEFNLDCRDFNSVGNIWYHGDVYYNGTLVDGWVFEDNIAKFYDAQHTWCTT
ncbi:hypothetical protein [Streptomyces sp. 8ZJF_21]|uniref:hypothetical protein n=1 Tax=Streptomyces sp. 8ZJF_21 TaxID=2903141 RepID=UPI001E5350A7|nr:hypothetical protein [Streptomyces sp. 8ZJF_21]MCD9592441.1 hypothetical protein [Streptomyces sp. 8ZJF_21]